jgi:hypothetical protein
MMISQLRKAFEDLAKLDAAKQFAELQLLKNNYGHSVSLLSDVNSNLSYNCVIYAMDVHKHGKLNQLLVHLTHVPNKKHGIYMDTGFLKMLIDDGDLRKVTSTSDCLAIYSTPEKITHIGRVTSDGRVRSKWGTAHIYEHDLLECPYSYGEVITFYKPIDPEVCVDRFFKYAKSKGARL